MAKEVGHLPSGADPSAEGADQARDPDLWAYARVACNGHVQYVRVG